MLTLLSERFAPLTSIVGFLRLPLAVAAESLASWRASLAPERIAVRPVVGTLEQLLTSLEPLTIPEVPRELLVPTTNPGWTAYFDCGADGSDAIGPIGHLTRTCRCQGLVVTTVPHTMGTTVETPGRYGAVQFQLFGPDDTDFLNYVRVVSVAHDGSRWRFDASGAVQPFENVSAYSARRIKDRFTSAMLAEYCTALSLAPFDPTFYGPGGVLVEDTTPLPADVVVVSLAEAQQRLGIKPAGAAVPG